ncbi:MAG TPA: SRPBCC domain-containing protein [Phycisphaerales bacterium]|nr:SRPBCC domain-containing protein [Phycisphaerales bacterium]
MASLTDPFSGEESFTAPPAKVYAILSSFDSYTKAIPGLVSSEVQPDGALKVAIKPGLSFVSGTVKATMRFRETSPVSRIVMTIDSSSVGMTLDLEAVMDIVPDGAGSKVRWTGRVTKYTGLVKLAPAALVRGAADKVVKDGWNELRKQIEA